MPSDAPDRTGSAMIACYPPTETAEALALPDGLDPGGMHLTVAYLGDASKVDIGPALAAASELLDRAPIDALVSGHARFTGGTKDVLVALVDSPGLERLRRDAVDALGRHGVPTPSEHGFTAHMTLAYLGTDEPGAVERIPAEPVRFDTLSLVHGETRIDLPLHETRRSTLAIESAARTAYADGWARSGGPMTPRVKAGCAAAIAMAATHADDPQILEATLKLGSLEGTWALAFDRRDQLAAAHIAAVTAIWRQLVHGHLRTAIRAFRHAAAVTEADDKPDPNRFKAAALDAARVVLGGLALDHAWDRLRRALRDTIIAGRAEGAVDAIAIAAERTGRIGLDFDIAFDDAYRALNSLGSIWADVDGWLGRMLDRAAADLGRVLSDGAASGASYDDMVADALDALDSEDVGAVRFVVDWALNTALQRGALDLYSREGVTLVSWLTAGDDRVCPACQANEDNSPFPINDYPSKIHPWCRCVPSAELTLTDAFDPYFTAA